jgi:hypothetical protein
LIKAARNAAHEAAFRFQAFLIGIGMKDDPMRL